MAAVTDWSVVAVDVGASSIRVRVETGEGRRRVLDQQHPGVSVTSTGLDLARVGGIVRHTVEQSQLDLTSTAIVIGTTGMPDVISDTALTTELESLGAKRTIVSADALTAHIGALGFEPGVVIAAGTGVVTLASDLDHVWVRIDGWGHLLGDEGGGAWIGARGLRAAMRAFDGRRRGSELLGQLARQRFGDPMDLVHAVYTRTDRARLLASFVPDVADAARAGDAVAIEILCSGSRLLADNVAAGVDRSGLRAVSYAGGIFALTDLVLEPMRRHLLSASGIVLQDPLGSPLDGAAELAWRAALEPHRVPHNPQFIAMIGDNP